MNTRPRRRKPVKKQEQEETTIPVQTQETPLKGNPYNHLLVFLLIVASFFLGSLYTKVQYLEKNTALPTTQAAAPTAVPNNKPTPLHVAKAIGIDPQKFKSCLETHKYAKQTTDDLTYGQQIGVNSTPSIFINGQLIVGAQPFETFKTVIDQEITQPNYPLPTGNRVNVDSGSLPALGDPNAPVAVVEFADFQCPFCERFFSTTESDLIKNYVNTGKIRFIFRNFSFLGPDSTTAAEGAYCANEQGKFWEYHNYLYQHQGPENSGTFSQANLE